MPALAALLLIAATAASFEAKVVGVVDADTLDVLDESKTTHRIRVHGIDSPERGQPFAKKSRAAMSALVAGQTVTVENLGDGRSGRMIAGGWACHYVSYNYRVTCWLLFVDNDQLPYAQEID